MKDKDYEEILMELCKSINDHTHSQVDLLYDGKIDDIKIAAMIDAYIILISKISMVSALPKHEFIYNVRTRMNELIDLFKGRK